MDQNYTDVVQKEMNGSVKKILGIAQKLFGLAAIIMFIATFTVTVCLTSRGGYWHIFGISSALFLV
jgi:hypothetical protein